MYLKCPYISIPIKLKHIYTAVQQNTKGALVGKYVSLAQFINCRW